LRPNVLLIHVQPNEGVSLAIGAKVPGQGMTIRTVHMDFLYGGAFREGLPEAYERLILDAMLGDATLFTRSDEIDEQLGSRRRGRRVLAARPPDVPELRGGHVGAGVGRRAAAPRRPLLETPLTSAPLIEEGWTGENVTVSEIERELARLRDATSTEGGQPNLRTSVMTHIAWVPPDWKHIAEETLAGMAERHPSRTLLLVPRAGEPDELGGAISPQRLTEAFGALRKRAKIRPGRLHDVRHSHATHLLTEGVPVHFVAARLGHSSPMVTLSVYAHVLPTSDEQAAATIAAVLET